MLLAKSQSLSVPDAQGVCLAAAGHQKVKQDVSIRVKHPGHPDTLHSTVGPMSRAEVRVHGNVADVGCIRCFCLGCHQRLHVHQYLGVESSFHGEFWPLLFQVMTLQHTQLMGRALWKYCFVLKLKNQDSK